MDASLRTIMPSCTANQQRFAVAGRPPPRKRHADRPLVSVFQNMDQRQLPSKHSSVRLAGLSALAGSWLRSAPTTLASMSLSWRVPFSTRTGLNVTLTNNAPNAVLERVSNVYIMLSPWIEFRRRPFTRSPTSRKTSCDVVATQRCRLWQSVWRPAAVPGHACASTGASPSRKL
jgi:hypothetical protein